ncbi:MAG: pitrilysin family protein [bacterium]
MKRLIIPGFIAILLLAFTSCAKTGGTTAVKSTTGPETLFNKPYRHIVLDNGLDVIMVKSDKQPIATIEIAARNGAYTQTPENCGLSHLYEHMFFKGNERWRTQEEYQKRIRELGIIYNGMTSNETVRYFFTVPSKNIEEGMEFMSYAIRKPLFDTTELKKEKMVVMNEFKRDFSQPDYIFYQETERAMFSDYFYRKNAIGEKDVILGATREQMIEIKNEFYTPGNCALIIAGDIDLDKTQKWAETYYASWEEGEMPDRDYPEHAALTDDKNILITADVGVSKMRMEYRGPDVDEYPEHTYPLDLLTEMFRMKSFPLREKLIESGLAYDFYAGYFTQQDGATFTFYSTLMPENVIKVREIILEEIDKMTSPDYFSDDMIQLAKERNRINFLYGMQSSRDFALDIGFWWAITGMDYFMSYPDKINAVDAESISRAVKQYLHNKHKVTGVLVNEEAADKYFDNSWKECER